MTINKINCGDQTSALLDSVNGLINSGQVINQNRLFNFYDQIIKLDSSDSNNFAGITGYGDSMASASGYVNKDLVISLQTRFGLGAVFTPAFGQEGLGSLWAFSGGASQPMSDFTYLPSACQVVLPSGSSANTTTTVIGYNGAEELLGSYPKEASQRDNGEDTLGFTVARCFYLTRPSDGSLTITLSQDGEPAYTPEVINCDSALAMNYVDIIVSSQTKPVELDVAANGGGCLFIGAAFYRTKGVLLLASNVGGSTMTEQNAYIDAGNEFLYSQLCQDLGVRLFIHSQRAGDDAAYQANYTKVFDTIDVIPNSCNLVLGEPPRATEADVAVATINKYLLGEATDRDYAYFDQNNAVGSSYQNLVDLGWEGDGVHPLQPFSRYLSGLILNGCGWLQVGVSKINIDPLTMANYFNGIVEIGSATDAQTSTISGRSETTVDSQSTAGGFAYNPTNEKGFKFDGAAALGHASGLIGNVSTGLSLNTNNVSYATTIKGYRNLQLQPGARAFFLVGVVSRFTSLSNLNERCYGFECALGSDVGTPDGVSGEVIRLLGCDGTTVTYGSWVDAKNKGVGQVSQTGLNVTVMWDFNKESIKLYRASNGSRELAAVMSYPYLASTSTTRASINMAVVAEDGGNIPSSSAFSFSTNEVNTRVGSAINGVVNNGF